MSKVDSSQNSGYFAEQLSTNGDLLEPFGRSKTAMSEAGDASASPKKSACSGESSSMAQMPIECFHIIVHGDLNRIHLIDQRIAAANGKLCDQLCKNIAKQYLSYSQRTLDVAFLQVMSHLRFFHLLVSPIIIRHIYHRTKEDHFL